MNHIQNVLKIGGSLGSFVLANSLDPTGVGGKCFVEIIKAITGNLASNFVANYAPEDLLKYLNSPNPELNHDIEKLMIESVEKAVQLVTVKYYQENPYDDKFVKKTLKSLIEDAKIMPNDTQNVLMNADKDAWLEGIHEYIFRGYEDEEGKLAEIEAFFIKHLKNCYELIFTEGLKDDKNEKPLKAFLIKSLNGLAEQTAVTSKIQNKILEEIQKLKDNQPAESLNIAKSYFDRKFKELNQKLDKVLEIAVKSDGNIELILQILKAFVENQPTKLPHHLTRHPLVPDVFEGRKDELEKIKKALFEDENLLLLVNGEGGIGKTSLAAKYYQKYSTDYKHLAWVLCEQSIADALLTLALPLKLQFDDTATIDQRLNILLRQMTNLDAPCLLIIDNANEVDDLQQNYEHLRSCPNFHVLLTSRINKHKNAKFLKIDSLPREQALVVFREHYPKLQTHEEPIFEGIYDAVGGNTLVLELLAKNVALQNTLKTKYSLPDLLADLQTKGLLNIVEDDDIGVAYQSYRTAKPTEIITAMYDLSKLSEAESSLLSVFAVLPAENIAFAILEQLLPQTPKLDKTLLSLAQKGWLNHNAADSTLKCNPVIQEITRAKNEKLYAECEELISALIDKLEYESGIGTLNNVTYVEGVLYIRFTESVLGNVQVSSYEIIQLYNVVGKFHETNGNIERATFYYEKGAGINEKLCEAEPNVETFENFLSISYCMIGNLQVKLGNIEEALIFYQKYNGQSEKVYNLFKEVPLYKSNLAISYEKLGELHQALGNLDKALKFFEKDCQISEELYRDYPNQVDFKNGVAISYEKLGNLQKALGNLDKALTFFEKYNQFNEELYRDYPNQVSFKNGLAISYERLGDLQKNLGNLDKALTFFENETILFEELYHDYPNQISFKKGLAVSYCKLGDLHQDFGNLDKALTFFEKYNQFNEELYRHYPNQVDFKNGLAISYSKLGELHQALGNLDKALTFFEKYNQLSEELYRDYPNHVGFIYSLATSYIWLGFTQIANNQKEKAKINYSKAMSILEDLCQKVPIPEYQNQLTWVKNALAGLDK